MAKYNITFSCGHKGTVGLIGKHDYREWKLNWYQEVGLCPECEKERKEEERKREREELEKYITELELPQLSGTQKQIEWANELRAKRIKRILETVQNNVQYDITLKQLSQQTNSAFWIEHRYDSDREFLDYLKQMIEKQEERMMENDIPQEIQEEFVIHPETSQHNGTVEISINETEVRVRYKKNETFREIVKRRKFKWNSDEVVWIKVCNEFTGSPIERASELTNKLLLNGFSVLCFNNDIVKNVQEGNFKPECTRWVDFHQCFKITWDRYQEDYYDKAKRLPNAKWNTTTKCIEVPKQFYAEVEDFCEVNNFSLTQNAKTIISQLKESERLVMPNMKEEKYSDKLKEILSTPVEVLQDLLDDED